MFKKICTRAIVPVAVAVTGFVIVCCLLLYSAIKVDMTNNAVQHSSALADTIVKSTRYAMLRSDWESIRNIIDNIGEQEGVEHVRIFNKKGLIIFSDNPLEVNHFVDKGTAGCVNCHAGDVPLATLEDMQKARTFVNSRQIEVLAITEPIYNEPSCSTADCHFHAPELKLVGTLDIGLDRSPLTKALAVLGGRMLVFSLMVLVVTVGGVAALLRRNVFLPIQQLTIFTDQVADGTVVDQFPAIGGELDQIADNFRRVTQQRDQALARLERMEENARTRNLQNQIPTSSDREIAEQEQTDGRSNELLSRGKSAGTEATLPGSQEEDP
ncbi:MAG: HAMP domain-containing protein [Desulfuromonadales bacterium]|nr:HAMP domain-containing protein [Desulfuromonadales bacterium]